MTTENQLHGGGLSAFRIPEIQQVANLWKKKNRGFISVLLFHLLAAIFFYLCVRLMDAINIINPIQEIVMALLGICAGLIGFFLFKKSIIKGA